MVRLYQTPAILVRFRQPNTNSFLCGSFWCLSYIASFRIFRLLLKQNNTHILGLMMKHDVLKPILDLTLQESRRDNLLSCSCQEYFESMRRVSCGIFDGV